MTGAHVILLHGILRTARHMRPLEEYLRLQGYAVHNLNYPSRRLTLSALTDYLHTQIPQRIAGASSVHFVGYSMGGLLARSYIARHRPAALGSVVQLAPPNTGSEVADAMKPYWAYRWLFGPAGQELGTDQTALQGLFGQVDYPLGILAGNRSWDPISGLFLPKPHDGKVSVARTKLEGMQAHKVLPAMHTFFPGHPKVKEETAHFLAHGRFTHDSLT